MSRWTVAGVTIAAAMWSSRSTCRGWTPSTRILAAWVGMSLFFYMAREVER